MNDGRPTDAPSQSFSGLAREARTASERPGASQARPLNGFTGWWKRLHRDQSGATSTEYILILTLVVLPIALLYPMFMNMVKTYGARMTSMMGLPFP